MAIYLCRRPKGDFFIVSPRTKGDAIEMRDEWGMLSRHPLRAWSVECMLDFRLADDEEIELANFGESTHDCIMETSYPELDKAFITADWDEAGLDYSARGPSKFGKQLNGSGRGYGTASRSEGG
jgi:hypothetical protein